MLKIGHLFNFASRWLSLIENVFPYITSICIQEELERVFLLSKLLENLAVVVCILNTFSYMGNQVKL